MSERIGNTPLLRLDKAVRGLEGVTLLAKAEWLNPGGSVKDRAASAMLREALAQRKLGPGKILLDATSGNTGIAFAMLGAEQRCIADPLEHRQPEFYIRAFGSHSLGSHC